MPRGQYDRLKSAAKHTLRLSENETTRAASAAPKPQTRVTALLPDDGQPDVIQADLRTLVHGVAYKMVDFRLGFTTLDEPSRAALVQLGREIDALLEQQKRLDDKQGEDFQSRAA